MAFTSSGVAVSTRYQVLGSARYLSNISCPLASPTCTSGTRSSGRQMQTFALCQFEARRILISAGGYEFYLFIYFVALHCELFVYLFIYLFIYFFCRSSTATPCPKSKRITFTGGGEAFRAMCWKRQIKRPTKTNWMWRSASAQLTTSQLILVLRALQSTSPTSSCI